MSSFYKGLVVISLLAHFLWVYLFCYVYHVGDDLLSLRNLSPETISKLGSQQTNLQVALDSISYAQQLGRLDIISILLGFFGILIGTATVGFFVYVRNDAKAEARDEAKRQIEHIAKEEMSEPWVADLITDTVEKAIRDNQLKAKIKEVFSDPIEDDVADRIPEILDEENDAK